MWCVRSAHVSNTAVAPHTFSNSGVAGVTADFALNIRKCPRLNPAANKHSSSSNAANSNSSSINPAAYVLADIKEQHPQIFR